ncbi:glycosyltransferase family 9 protein [bacterium]|nr:glycosyltransferase family 9 protein [bacterium]
MDKSPPLIPQSKASRIAMIRFSSLGDIILTLGVIRTLKQSWPDCHLAVIVKEQYAVLFDQDPDVDEVMPLYRSDQVRGNPMRDLLARFRAGRFDLVLDLHANIRSRVLGLVHYPKRVIRYSKGSVQRRFLVLTGYNPGRIQAVSERYLETIRPWCAEEVKEVPRLHCDRADRDKAGDVLRAVFPGDGPLIGCAPGARHFTKRWPLERYAELIGLLRSLAGRIRGVVVFGDEKETGFGRYLYERYPDFVLDRTGSQGLRETAALIAGCAAFVSNDTGLMHMATAVGTPVLALFGPTSREFGFFPMGPRDQVIEHDLGCRPCSLHGGRQCPLGTFACLSMIQADEVYSRLMALLDKSAV